MAQPYFRRITKLCFYFLFMSVFSAFAQPSRKVLSECAEVSLSQPQPRWISSASFVKALESIAIIDPVQNQIFLTTARGRSGAAKLGIQGKPATISRTSTGFVLSTVDQRLYLLDKLLRPIGSNDLVKASIGSRGTLVSTYQSVVSGSEFFSFGAVKTAANKFRFGFFRVPAETPSNFEFLLDFDDVEYYLLGHQYLASLNGHEYAVLMSGKASIIEFLPDGSQRNLEVIPDSYRQVNKLETDTSRPHAEEDLFREIEKMSIPVGLYGQDGFLYLLTRERNPKPRSGTLWQLFPIDPEHLEVSRPLQIPTTANHLTVVNSEDNWYFIEKGPVQEDGSQDIGKMLIIPNASIRTHAIPAACKKLKSK